MSRSIGDFGIKHAKFNRASSFSSTNMIDTAAVTLRTPGFGIRSKPSLDRGSSDGRGDIPTWAGRRATSFHDDTGRPSPLDLLTSTVSSSEEEDEDADSDGGLALSPYFSHKEWTRENAGGNFPLAAEALKQLKTSRRLGSFGGTFECVRVVWSSRISFVSLIYTYRRSTHRYVQTQRVCVCCFCCCDR